MPQEIRLWRISRDNRLIELDSQPLDLESRLEIWLEQDVAVLSPDLLVIGRQLTTDHGGFIDLLCLDRNGDTVIVELKRGKTPREVTAQALDYASWVRDLSHDEIIAIAEAYLSDRRGMDLPRAFAARFGSDLPEVLNDDHSILVVASSVDPSSERIIRYLSEAHGVRINAMTFHYFPDSQGTEHIARAFLLEPEVVEQRSVQRGGSKRRANRTLEDYEAIAQRQGVAEVYQSLLSGLREHLQAYPMVTQVGIYGKLDGGIRAMLGLLPTESSQESGLHFTIYLWRVARFLGIDVQQVENALPAQREPWKYVSTSEQDESGFAGYFRDLGEVERFLAIFQASADGIERQTHQGPGELAEHVTSDTAHDPERGEG